jgi:hypothetical protein
MLSAALAARQGGSPQADPTSRQNPAVTFKVEINYVEVDAVVTDREGRFIADLSREDFEILEDGKRQSASSFGLIDIPVEKAPPLFAPGPPTLSTNQRPFTAGHVLLLDDSTDGARRWQAAATASWRQLGARRGGCGHHCGKRFPEFTASKRLPWRRSVASGKSPRSATLNRVTIT